MIISFVDDGIYRGGRPDNYAKFKLQDMKIKTVVNLESGFYERMTGHRNDESLWCLNNLMTPINIKLSNFLSPTVEELKVLVHQVLEDEYFKPIYIHCKHGVDRTGMLVAAYRILHQDMEPERAIEEMLMMGFHKFPYYFWIDTLRKLK